MEIFIEENNVELLNVQFVVLLLNLNKMKYMLEKDNHTTFVYNWKEANKTT